MIDVIRAAVGIFAALAPFALVPATLALPEKAEVAGVSGRTIDFALSAAFGFFVVAVLLTDPFLGFLDVSPENFQGAAAVIVLPLAARLLWSGRSLDPGERVSARPWLMPLAVPGLAGPASLAVVIAYTGRYGEIDAILASGVALTLAGGVLFAAEPLKRKFGDLPLSVLGRLSGALIVAIALELAVDGVRSV